MAVRPGTAGNTPMPGIYIVPIETRQEHWIGPLRAALMQTFGILAHCARLPIALAPARDRARGQYDSSHLLRQLIAAAPADACKVLGVVNVDLFVPVLTFVFGEAQLGGIAAVVSMHRLHDTCTRQSGDRALMCQRLVKEAIHELGHTFGLVHCDMPGCVMNTSTRVAGIDRKSRDLCVRCRQRVRTDVDAQAGTVR